MKMNRVKSSFENWKSILGFRCTYKFVYNEGVEGHSPSIDRFVNPFGFTGYQRENVGGMLYAQARYYMPGLGRFNSEDGARDGLNWYEYARSNPLGFVDPSGNITIAIPKPIPLPQAPSIPLPNPSAPPSPECLDQVTGDIGQVIVLLYPHLLLKIHCQKLESQALQGMSTTRMEV